MSFLRRIGNAALSAATNVVSGVASGARRLVSAVVPEAVQQRVNTFTDWVTSYVEPTQINQVLNEVTEHVRRNYPPRQPFEVRESSSALRRFTTQYTIDGREGYDPQSFLNAVRQNVTNLLRNNRRTRVKLILNCNMEMVSIVSETGTTIDPASFHSNVEVNLEGTDVDELYDAMVDRALEAMATFQMRGSNWTFRSIISLEIHTVAYEPLRGSSYIPLPKVLATKKAIINMKNKDNECFKWCVTRVLNPVERDAERISKILRVQAERLNMTDIEYPVSLKAIDKVEKQNPDISVNVFGYESAVHPLRISKHVNRPVEVNLLLISDEEKQHYCIIKDMSRLLSSQTSNKKVKHHYCLRCLNPFYSQDSLNKHMEYCYSNETVKIEMPEEGSTISFNNFNRSMRVPFIVYADFESFIKPIDTCEKDPDKSYTKQYNKHTPSSFCYYIKCFDDKVYSKAPVTYTAKSDDEDVAQKFVDMLEADVKEISNRPPKKMIFGQNDRVDFENATKCWICQGEFEGDGRRANESAKKVRDHCHFTGKYRGAAHNKCNLKYKKPNFTPVVFHNLSGYDSHLFIKNLGKSEGNINCIPNNEEKYISFTKEVIVDTYTEKDGKEKDVKHQLRFIDSIKFMASSLDKLTGNLGRSCFKNTSKYFNGELRKGVYPYEYMDSVNRLSETTLPPKEAFYSRLSGKDISDEDYEHAKKVWKQFGMKTLRDYHDFYNQSDVLLLADVFENFRDVCSKNYGLDPAWYYTAPGLAWDAALKITEVKLELLSDVDMLNMVEKGIRGGISMISNRYGKANNPYMKGKYKADQTTKYITYLDANNLYGWAMSKPLPTHGFKWMSGSELNSWKNHSCILEVDMEYPKELHDHHNDYPLAPESLKVDGSTVAKLIPNLNDKEKYVIHYENLKLYESLGLKITKIHRGIKFDESAWLKQYIDLNTNLRAKANNEFEKDFFKLMNNSERPWRILEAEWTSDW